MTPQSAKHPVVDAKPDISGSVQDTKEVTMVKTGEHEHILDPEELNKQVANKKTICKQCCKYF